MTQTRNAHVPALPVNQRQTLIPPIHLLKSASCVSLAALCALSAYWQFASAADKPGKGEQAPTSVSTATALRQDVPILLSANANVTPVANLELRPQVSNTIAQVHIKEGEMVKQGQLMFSLDQRNEQANLAKARAQLAKDQASLQDLQRQLQRSQELAAQKFISQSSSDSLQAQVQSQLAQINLDKANISSAQVALAYTQIKAPMSGRIGAINVYPGSLVQTSTVLAQITQLDPIQISFTLPEKELPALLAARKQGKVKVQASLPNSTQWLDGQLSFIDNAIDTQAGNIKLKAEFDNRQQQLWPGQYVQAQLTVSTMKNAIVIPLAAIVTNAYGKSVYILDGQQSAKQMPISVKYSFGTQAVVSGLQAGEKVIVDGKQNLRPGGKVKELLPNGPSAPGNTDKPSKSGKQGGKPA